MDVRVLILIVLAALALGFCSRGAVAQQAVDPAAPWVLAATIYDKDGNAKGKMSRRPSYATEAECVDAKVGELADEIRALTLEVKKAGGDITFECEFRGRAA